ncbi:cupin domain-containing protein [Streptomyces sp. NPDC006798]|uniref:JmjC domain-containing protein n=1 Tax=Streptomyces sp. NPDC006798 TaxID=3155462 RepID=UPI0033C34E77
MTTPDPRSPEIFRYLAPAWIRNSASTDNGQPTHLPGLLPPHFHPLHLPIGDQRSTHQPVAFVDDSADSGFRRTASEADIEALRRSGTTRVYESLDVRSDGWHSQVSSGLARLLRRQVTCSVYESRTGDRSLGPHHDDWHGLILQTEGAKTWTLWPEGGPVQIDTRAGDVLIIPWGLLHDVTTPPDPGHSVHVAFAVRHHLKPACPTSH